MGKFIAILFAAFIFYFVIKYAVRQLKIKENEMILLKSEEQYLTKNRWQTKCLPPVFMQ